MSLENGEDLDGLRLAPTHDSVASLDDFANADSRKLGYRPAHLGELRQPVSTLDNSVDKPFGTRRGWPGR